MPWSKTRLSSKFSTYIKTCMHTHIPWMKTRLLGTRSLTSAYMYAYIHAHTPSIKKRFSWRRASTSSVEACSLLRSELSSCSKTETWNACANVYMCPCICMQVHSLAASSRLKTGACKKHMWMYPHHYSCYCFLCLYIYIYIYIYI